MGPDKKEGRGVVLQMQQNDMVCCQVPDGSSRRCTDYLEVTSELGAGRPHGAVAAVCSWSAFKVTSHCFRTR